MKVCEFVLVDVRESEGMPWSLSEDKVMLRGIVEIDSTLKEVDIRERIGKAIRVNYGTISNTDFEFLRATRRKLSKPVNCGNFDFKQIKLIAGQGSLYVKLKDWIYCLVGEEGSDQEEVLMNSVWSDDEHGVNAPSQHDEPSLSDNQATTNTASATPPLPQCDEETGSNITEEDHLKDVNGVAEKIIAYCKEHTIEDPVEILRHYQKVMVVGRALRVQNNGTVEEGETNFISVDRFNILETALEEIKSLQNLRLTLEVEFYGEVSSLFII